MKKLAILLKKYRKTLLIVVFAVLCSAGIGYIPFKNINRTQVAATEVQCPASEVNIVAHQDDDILFMNPDIQDSITQRRCVETVFLTSGEWNGTSSMNREQYAASRMLGSQAAYASMAHVADDWSLATISINGHLVEAATLQAAPNVKLLYMDIRDGNDKVSTGSLANLYAGTASNATTIVPVGVPTGIIPIKYTKLDLNATLQAIMTNYHANVIRTQDYLPDSRLHIDHPDHINGARFATDAARNYSALLSSAVNIVAYRDYNIEGSPVDLSAEQAVQKDGPIAPYHAHDSLFVIPGTQGQIASRMYYRWPVAPVWSAKNFNGTLQAFAVLNGELKTWVQAANGSWGTMSSLGNDSLQPGVSITTNLDGTLQVFAVKQSSDTTGKLSQDVQYIKQSSPGGSFSAWTSLGSPGPGLDGTYDVSAPSAVLNAAGRVEVFVKDSNGNLSRKYMLRNGQYSGWETFVASNSLIESPAAVLRPDGRIEVFTASLTNVKHWLQDKPNGSFSYDPLSVLAQAVGTPSVGFNQDGRPEIFYRNAGSGQIYTVFQTTNGTWYTRQTSLSSQSSLGAPAVVNTLPLSDPRSQIRLLERTSQSGYRSLTQRSANSTFAQPWQPNTSTYSQFAPTAILDNQNIVHVLSLSQDGALVDSAQTVK